MGISPRTNNRESGQAAVEAALTLPLMLFLLLGTLQLFLMMHARILTQLAAFQVTRTGSMNHGNCARMLHAGILQVLPAIDSFARPTGRLATNVATAFARYANNSYDAKFVAVGPGGPAVRLRGEVLWIVRRFAGRQLLPFGESEDDRFDQDVGPMRLETQVIFWFPMKIPFANWVMARMMLAHYGIQAYANQNPLLMTQRANWTAEEPNQLSAELRDHLRTQLLRGRYIFPIVASYTMRMMTPLKPENQTPRNCPGTPTTL